MHIWGPQLMWPCDTIWQYRSWPTLGQVMGLCLTAPSHYLNQWWLFLSEVLWHSHESNFSASAKATIIYRLYKDFEYQTFQFTATFPRGQWVDNRYTLLVKNSDMFLQSFFGHWWFEIMFCMSETNFQTGWWDHVNGLAQDCGNPIAYALELP